VQGQVPLATQWNRSLIDKVYADMIGRHCPARLPTEDGGPWRGFATTGLCRVPGSVLDLSTLRSRASLLQRRMPRSGAAPTTAARQLPSPAQPGRAARPSRPATGVPPPETTARDGSRFRFDHLSGNLFQWDTHHTPPRSFLALHYLRTEQSLGGSFSPHPPNPEMNAADDRTGNPR
jgi:hypothetical protein